MAEGVFRAHVSRAGVQQTIDIDSVGTHDYHEGEAPFKLAVETAKKRGYEIGNIVSRRVNPGDLDRFDMILCMDRANLVHLRTIAPTRCKQKIELLLEYGDKYHGKDIPDPYGGDTKAYEKALDMIEDGVEGVVQLLRVTAARA
jgi:protein-tyrosine phosphatase